MKKLSVKQRLFLIARSKNVIAARTKLACRAKRRLWRRAKLRTHTAITVRALAPKLFKVRSAIERVEFLAFLERIERSLDQRKRVFIDLQQVEELHPCGTLIFLAKLEIWGGMYPGQLSANYPGDDVAEQLLQHVGALQRLGLTSRQKIISDRVVPWHFHSGDEVAASAYEALTVAVLGNNIEHPEKLLFADCLNEAVTNSVGHAYKFSVQHTPPEAQQKWWIFSLSRDDRVFVSIYDSGVTIPKSLRRKEDWAAFLKNRTHWKDSRLIEAAAMTEKTSTKMPHRGKGLPEMVEFSRSLSSGGLSILSGSAVFSYNADKNTVMRKSSDGYIPGTLVLWHIPFHKERKSE